MGNANNRQWGNRAPAPAPTDRPIFANKKFRATGADLPASGLSVKLGKIFSKSVNYNGQDKTEFTLYLQDAAEGFPRGDRGKPLPVKMSWALRCDIISALTGLKDDELKNKAKNITEIEWAADYEGRTVEFFPFDWEFVDQAASQEAGTEIKKTTKLIKARKFTGASSHPVIEKSTQSNNAPSQAASVPVVNTDNKAKYEALAARHPEMKTYFLPLNDGPAQWTIATAKLQTAVNKLNSLGLAMHLEKPVSQLIDEGNIEPLLTPWKIEDAAALFGVASLVDVGDLPLVAVRNALGGV